MHDKKSDHYTSAKNYTDLDGLSRSFTFIDHDPKTRIATMKSIDMEEVKNEISVYKESLVNQILALPASICPSPFWDYTVRGAGITAISWNEKMLRDPGSSVDRLRDLKTMLDNRVEIDRLTY